MAATRAGTSTRATSSRAALHIDRQSLFPEQRRQLATTETLDSDLDFALDLQLQEAINASLSHLPSTSSGPPPAQPPIELSRPIRTDAASTSCPTLQPEEIFKLKVKLNDRKQREAEMRRMREGCSKGGETDAENNIFRLYFKGLVSEERVRGGKAVLAGIGVAICDPRDNSVFKISKPLIGNGTNKSAAECKALIEGLGAALALELRRIAVYCEHYPLYQFLIGKWPPRQRKIATLVNQASLLQRKFLYCNTSLVARKDMRFAFKLARDAIFSQITRPEESNDCRNLNETCAICLEDTDVKHMFSVDGCQHRFCCSCMKQHVEVKLLHGMVPKCPHEACNSELNVDSCRKFLIPKLIETMRQRIKEASIPVSERIYCPYPKCSALMSKSEVYAFVDGEGTGARKCSKCHGLFCINCKVPWHSNMTCVEYKRRNPNPPAEDLKLKSLATRNLWRQCVKCNHMIELAEGCYHMTCRCGYEFCYNCGAEWKNKRATCSCPLWDEHHIWHDDHDTESDEEDVVEQYEDHIWHGHHDIEFNEVDIVEQYEDHIWHEDLYIEPNVLDIVEQYEDHIGHDDHDIDSAEKDTVEQDENHLCGMMTMIWTLTKKILWKRMTTI